MINNVETSQTVVPDFIKKIIRKFGFLKWPHGKSFSIDRSDAVELLFRMFQPDALISLCSIK